MLLIDKGYYDYDYQEPKTKAKLTAEDMEIWSQEKLNAILGVKPKPKPMSPEEAQQLVITETKISRE